MTLSTEIITLPPITEAAPPTPEQLKQEFNRLVIRASLHVPFGVRESALTKAQQTYGIEPAELDMAKQTLVDEGTIRIMDTVVVHGEAFQSQDPLEVEQMGVRLRGLVQTA